MRRTRIVPFLLAAILLPSVALIALGSRAFRDETRRARARLAEQAVQAVDAARAALERGLEQVARGETDALAVRADASGALVAPRLSRAGDEAGGPREPALFRFLESEVDRLEAAGELERAQARLAQVAERDGDAWLAAWAWSTLAALRARAGDTGAARAAWSELVARHPRVRDQRGLVRSFAARLALLELDGFPQDDLLALYADAGADLVSREELATRRFLDHLRSLLRERAPAAELARVEAAERERERVRSLDAAWRAGAGDWVARGAPGGVARFRAAPDPLTGATAAEWIVSSAREADGEGDWRGGALELERFVRTSLALPEIAAIDTLGFATVVETADGEVLAASRGEVGAPSLARRVLAPPLSGLSVSASGVDVEGLLRRERRSFLIVAALVGLALLVSVLAAVATVRGIGREVAATRSREAFVAAVTHELKAPLASIRLLGEVLAGGGVEEGKVREFGRRAAGEAERLSRVITSVLELARLEHRNGSAAPTAVDLNQIARDAVRTFEPLARERGFGLTLRESARPARVRADAQAIGGALLNLLDNALKYSDQPHEIEVELTAPVDGRATLAVLDRGRGVAAGERAAIFEPFRRVGDELTRDRPGVGLGLALVRRIAEAHGGRASCTARAGGGSRFLIELPAIEEAGTASRSEA